MTVIICAIIFHSFIIVLFVELLLSVVSKDFIFKKEVRIIILFCVNEKR